MKIFRLISQQSNTAEMTTIKATSTHKNIHRADKGYWWKCPGDIFVNKYLFLSLSFSKEVVSAYHRQHINLLKCINPTLQFLAVCHTRLAVEKIAHHSHAAVPQQN